MDYNMYKKEKSKGKGLLIALIIIVLLILAVLFFVGITLGSDSAERTEISGAVAENAELRREIAEKDARISELEKTAAELEEKLRSYPAETPAPETESSPEPTAEAVSPRG